MKQQLHRTDVAQVFRDHEIMLTGANGFLGKVLVGLLLDRLPRFRHLHLLSRAGRDLSARERFYTETLRSPALAGIVERIAEKRGPEFLAERITVWPGDISLPRCGLAEADLENLSGRIGAVINCAGLVEFFPPIDEAFGSNVDGVENVVALAETFRAKLVHISTCYVCGEADGLIEETEPILGYYPHRKGQEDTTFDHEKELAYCRQRIRQICESGSVVRNSRAHKAEGESARVRSGVVPKLPPGAVAGRQQRSREVIQRLISFGRQRAEHWGWVNTYTYSKSLGEQIIASRASLDYAIVRPAIVESALHFPFAGWIEGGRTAAPLVLMALGGLRDWPVRCDIPLEVVPVDLVASAILVVTALLLEGRSEHVYQLGSADVNPVDLETLVRLLHAESHRRMRTNGRMRTNEKLRSASPSPAPSLVERFFSRRSGRLSRPRFISAEETRARRTRLQERIGKAQIVLDRTGRMLQKTGLPGRHYLSDWSASLRTLGLRAGFREQTLDQYLPFVLHNRYIFESENIRAAYSLISEGDRQRLSWEPERIDWKDYWINHQIKGIEKWVQPEAVKEWNFRM